MIYTITDNERFILYQTDLGRLILNDRWVSVDEIAQHIGVAKDTIYRWIENRGFPAHRVGRRLWKFQLSEVDDWIKRGGVDDISHTKKSHQAEDRKITVSRSKNY